MAGKFQDISKGSHPLEEFQLFQRLSRKNLEFLIFFSKVGFQELLDFFHSMDLSNGRVLDLFPLETEPRKIGITCPDQLLKSVENQSQDLGDSHFPQGSGIPGSRAVKTLGFSLSSSQRNYRINFPMISWIGDGAVDPWVRSGFLFLTFSRGWDLQPEKNTREFLTNKKLENSPFLIFFPTFFWGWGWRGRGAFCTIRLQILLEQNSKNP